MERDEVKAGATKVQATSPEPVFKTERIGEWRAKQDTPFEKQNREREKQKQRSKARNKKIRQIALWSGGAVVVAAAVVVTLMLTVWKKPVEEPPIEIAGNTVEAVNSYQDQLKEIYESSDNNMEKVQEAVDATLATDEGKKHADAVKAAQIVMLGEAKDYQAIVEIADEIDDKKLDYAAIARYCNAVANAYRKMGDIEKANEYQDKAGNAIAKSGQGMGGGV